MRAPLDRKTRVVLAKEWRDSLRDRRSLASACIFCLFGPLVVAWALISLAGLDDDQLIELPVAGAERAPSLIHFLEQREVDVIGPPTDAAAAVGDGTVDAVLVIPPTYPDEFRASRTAEVELLYDGSRSAAAPTVERLRRLLETYSRDTAGQRLLVRGLSPELLQAVAVESIDCSTTTSRAARLLLMLPIFLLMATFVGGMNVAIDVTAGERERASLESLLLHPVSRLSLVAGKWGAATLLNFAVVLMTLAVSVAVLSSPRLQSLDLGVGLGPGEAAAALAVLLPLVVFAPALQMLISTFARSFKEAQSYLSLLILLPALPGFFFAFRSARPEPWMDRVPLLGHQTLITMALRGESPAPVDAAVLAALTVGMAVACFALTARLLRDERIVLSR